MGHWRSGCFDNDDALRFIEELDAVADLSLVRAALDILLDDAEYLGWPEAARVLVAGEMIAAMRGEPAGEWPMELDDWVGRLEISETDGADLEQARKAVRRVARDEQLKNLFVNPNRWTDFENAVSSLLHRLS